MHRLNLVLCKWTQALRRAVVVCRRQGNIHATKERCSLGFFQHLFDWATIWLIIGVRRSIIRAFVFVGRNLATYLGTLLFILVATNL
jgi:hypothetical protein